MKSISLFAVLFTMLVLPSAGRGQSDDEAAVRELHGRFVTAWNKHDPKAMAGVFAADGDLVNPFGRVAKGREEIAELFTDEHSGPMADSKYEVTAQGIRQLGSDVAIIDIDATVTGIAGPDGSAAPPFAHHVTWVAVKKDGKWQAACARAFVAVPRP